MDKLTLASIEYYITLITLLHIHISADTIIGLIASNSLVNSTRRATAEVLPLAIVNLETIIYLYYIWHSFKYYDGHLTTFLITIYNITMESRFTSSVGALDADAHEHLRSTLALCLRGLAN